MRTLYCIIILLFVATSCQTDKTDTLPQQSSTTLCNPLDLSYRFCLDEPSRREAADPTIIRFKDRYYLFASKTGGYWHSTDLLNWELILTSEIPTEEYAPTVIAINDILYFLASSNEKSTIYKSSDPLSGKWSIAKEELEQPVWDPAFFLDDDNKLYLYWGCSNENPLYGVELDTSFSFLTKPVELKQPNPAQFGWEVPGDYNTIERAPWIEGAWVNKYDGKYYLQYAGPGTEFKSYSDAVYVSDSPLGPFEPQSHNPFAYKPEGFAAGAGHGSTFEDAYGNYWHIGTMTISEKHMFERRLGLFPTFFDKDGTLHSVTKYGDYPITVPQNKVGSFEEIFAGWMLLSYNKSVEVSSSIDSLPATGITDENIRTYWSATTGNKDEFAIVDLGEQSDVSAIQINFAEHNTSILGRKDGIRFRYTLEYSNDKQSWNMIDDQSNNESDRSHPYLELATPINARYIKLTNIEVPSGNFALSGLRVFGKGKGTPPKVVTELMVHRNPENKRSAHLKWEAAEGADGYVLSYGTDSTKLYQNYMIYGEDQVMINSLDASQAYYFTIEAFNANGITRSDLLMKVD